MYDEPEAAAHIRKFWTREGIEVVNSDDRSITVTLGVDVEDLSVLIEELRDEYGLVADYRFCSETKLGTLVFTHAGDAAGTMPGGGNGSFDGAGHSFFVFTTATLAVLSGLLAITGPIAPAFLNGTLWF